MKEIQRSWSTHSLCTGGRCGASWRWSYTSSTSPPCPPPPSRSGTQSSPRIVPSPRWWSLPPPEEIQNQGGSSLRATHAGKNTANLREKIFIHVALKYCYHFPAEIYMKYQPWVIENTFINAFLLHPIVWTSCYNFSHMRSCKIRFHLVLMILWKTIFSFQIWEENYELQLNLGNALKFQYHQYL